MIPSAGSRLKIAFVVHDYNNYGGHSRYVAELARRYRHRHEVHVFANTFDDADTEGMTLHRVPAVRRSALSTILSFVLPATFQVRGTFDIVHAQGLCGLRQNVTTAHMVLGAWYRAILRETGRLTLKQRVFRVFGESLERMTYRRRLSPTAIAISARVRDDLASCYNRREAVEVIHHGVDFDTFRPRPAPAEVQRLRGELGLPIEAFVCLYAGDMQKGAIPAIRAVAKVPGAHLAVVSRTPDEPYRQLARREGVADRVLFFPFSKEIEKWFAAADLFVYPTWYDPFGMVVSEAMACGTPVLTSPAAGASEWITHGVDGWLTRQAWDADEIAGGIASLMRDTAGLRKMGERARLAVESQTWDRVAEETMAVYRRQLDRERERGGSATWV